MSAASAESLSNGRSRKRRREQAAKAAEEAKKNPEPATTPAQITAKNTARLVEIGRQQLDVQRMVFGGGNRAAMGVSAVSLAGMNRRSNGPGNYDISNIEGVLEGIVYRVMRDLKRGG